MSRKMRAGWAITMSIDEALVRVADEESSDQSIRNIGLNVRRSIEPMTKREN